MAEPINAFEQDFIKLSPEAKRIVLNDNPDFKSMSKEGQDLVIERYTNQFKPPVQQEAPKPEQPEPSGLSVIDKMRIAAGSGLANAVRGIDQLSLKIPDPFSGIPEYYRQRRLKELAQATDENRRIMAPLKKENPYLVGGSEFVGEALPLAPLPGGTGGGLLTRILTGIGGGMAAGALQPTGTRESTVQNTVLGGVGGGIMPVAMAPVSKLVNTIAGKSPKNVIDTLGKKYNIKTTLGETTDNPISKRTETWLEQLPVIGIKGFREKQEQQAQEAATKHFMQYVVDPSTTNTAAMKDANDRFINAMYDKVKSSAQGLKKTSAPKTQEVSTELLTRYPETFQNIQDNKTKKILAGVSADVSKKDIEVVTVKGSGRIPSLVKPEKATTGGGYYIRESSNRLYGGNNPQWYSSQAEAQKVSDAINKRLIDKTSQTTSESITVPKKFSFDDLWELRKGVGQEIRDARTDTARGQLKRLYSAISDDIDSQLSQGNSTAMQDFKAANEAFKKYSVKFDVLREAYDKAAGTIGAGEEFSPKKYSTALKNLANDPNYKKHVKWSQREIDEMTGLANILQVVKRASQINENPPTGNRWGLLSAATGVGTGGLIAGGVPGLIAAMGITGSSALVTRFLTTTATGKALARSASKFEPNSPQMKRLMDTVYGLAVKTPGIMSDNLGGQE